MATFGKRVQPRHRADPADRRRDTAPAPRPGTHAAPVSPEVSVAERSAPPRQEMPPRADAHQSPAPQAPHAPVSVVPPAAPAAEPGTLKVLIVDDNEDVRGLLRIAFARAEIKVVGAASGSGEALELAQRDQPDIVLLDVNLPGIAGLDILPLLREQCPQTRVVMFSAQCGHAVIETARERGAVGFVEKGVSMKSVISHLREVVAAPDGRTVEPFPLRVYP
jgi:CheY-like chemotaxis protein